MNQFEKDKEAASGYDWGQNDPEAFADGAAYGRQEKPIALPVKMRVDLVLTLLNAIGTVDTTNRYVGLQNCMAGAKGRVVTFWTGFQPVEIHGKFWRDSITGAYMLEFHMTVRTGASTLAVMQAATRIAELQAQAPSFTPAELQDIYAALDESLGPVKTVIY